MPNEIKTPEDLRAIASSVNIAEYLEPPILEAIGNKVVEGYDEDLGNMQDQFELWDEIQALAMQIREKKNWPWPDASNIKYPLITDACIQFGARIYSDIVQTGNIVKTKVNGKDPEGVKEQRADRVKDHMNYQLSDGIVNWEQDTDILLSMLPAYGIYYKKLYFSQIENRPVVEICNGKRVITSGNSHLIDEDERVSDLIELSRNKIIERIRAGLFLNEDIPQQDNEDDDEQGEQEFIEQHRFLDLDNDGYDEPYVVTVHRESKQVFRIVARFTENDIETIDHQGKELVSKIRAFCHFVKYYFWSSFDGSTLYLGLGQLLLPLNESINTLTNQLIDSGTINNLQSGFFGRGIRMEGGPFRLAPGEWQPVEGRGGSLRDNIVPLPTKEPSQTLFSLLGLMVDSAKQLAMATDVSPAEMPANTPAISLLAAIEEGIKVYSSIYKRIYRSVKTEMKKIFYLNSVYGDPQKYIEFLDDENANFHADYNLKDMDVALVASPEVSSDMQRVLKAQALISLLDSQGAMASGLNPREIMQNYLEAIRQPNIEQLLPEPPPPSDEPSLQEQMIQMQAEIETAKVENQRLDIERKIAETEAKIVAIQAKGIKDLAEAEAAEAGTQLDEYQATMNELRQQQAELPQGASPQTIQ